MKPILAVSGLKNSGKTTLCLRLALLLKGMGIRVGFLKHTHEDILCFQETDTGRLLAGGIPAILWGPDGIRAESAEDQPDLEGLIERLMPEVDLVILEGGKGLPLPRVWVGRPEDCPEGVKGILAWYCPESVPGGEFFYGSGDEPSLARFLVDRLMKRRDGPEITLRVDGRRIPLKPFLADFLQGAVQGMIQALKDTDGREISIHVRRKDQEI